MKFFLIAGAVNALLSVAFGAFGAHLLEGRVADKYLDTWQTAVQYQMFHAVGLMVIAILMSSSLLGPLSSLNWAGYLMLAGIVIFSGSLYVLSLTGISILGAITPIGGVAFIAAWVMIIVAAVKAL
ncbi:DUF423 domain-containing protein [Microbacterium sp. APC 3898]|uniref:DUF423 domain-containing protein n=2 Tax=Planococcus TaxID=1372 RepID=A0ABT7ZKY8_9BACL|nr:MULTISPECIES: DUF423 domain-containing protein [Terrabacteria group]MBF6633264.1 DUF423 domain-containing protein [Planococcus sp. (in: firmicutes)]MBD8013246.1 DUF423 domain-containing protein [Planococcus wigleyi]MDN3427822.1 DUF423 domain-containing protein [Planococcus sp. APC 4016]MDN3437176.1 DUF423 domain-containing protein [Planococcus sp. APC 3900]MDN3499374.1 DUF423 domain-containing protein [Microbacterium sp. APC 3898]